MNAVDTNIVVRIFVNDDKKQAAAARSIFESGPVWISQTVLLETAWVLGRHYNYEQPAICEALASLPELDHVYIEDEDSLKTALSLMSHGIDPADAMHLASTPAGSSFATFDRDLVRKAKRAGASNVSAL
jgi:predicted nucleic-acid-binding protein